MKEFSRKETHFAMDTLRNQIRKAGYKNLHFAVKSNKESCIMVIEAPLFKRLFSSKMGTMIKASKKGIEIYTDKREPLEFLEVVVEKAREVFREEPKVYR